MKISRTLTRICGLFLVVAILFLTAGVAGAQTDSVKKKRLRSPAAVKGFVGGESHDSYVIHARKNQTLRVQISWQGKGDRTAQFVVSKSVDFFSGDVVEGGKETYDGKNWVGKVPATGDYYVLRQSFAKYFLRAKPVKAAKLSRFKLQTNYHAVPG